MIQRRTRDYEVSLWTLQDSPIAILKPYGLEFKGQIQDGKLQDKDDGTQTFTFSIPMYLIRNGLKIENPCWYNVLQGHLLANLRKIKVIFNKNYENGEDRKIYEFLIVKATENHEELGLLFCDVECEGLAFHELGKLGYKISLTAEDFYNDDYDWSINGKWITGKGKLETLQPLASLNYWNDKVFGTTDNWDYEIQMDWSAYSLWEYTVPGNLTDTTVENDLRTVTASRLSNKVYEDDFVDSWELDKQTEQIIPKHITGSREKARVSLDIHDSNIYNITQTLALAFGVFCKYVYLHDENLRITKRKVVYYNNFLKENEGVMDITYPYQISSVKREIDSSDIVTKLFVKQVLDDSSSDGVLNILDVGANKSKEDYILNFDYLYQSGGITKLQYEAIDTYITNIRKVNEQIAPYSAKVISLESQLVKLLAELTTRTNAIAKDTEELAMGQELLNAITNGSEVLQVTENNPQSVVLMKDTTKSNNSYYIKLTQKGIYPETIHIYKKYSYLTAKLDGNSLIKTGKVEFDEFGNVNKVSNIFYTESDPKTVYITYSYRPKMYYESIVEMWSARLANDTAQKAELDIQIAKINYNLYGRESKYSMKGINLADITDVNLKGKFKNLLEHKNNLIKLFNALMGPALRLGYWQPENYTDYGDQYNDSFNVSLVNSNIINGTTGNSYFLWDDELFDNEQKLYYEYTAGQVKIPYPCIDLTTPHGRQILQLMVNNEDALPISFVFKPVTAEDDNPYPTAKPVISHPSTKNNLIYVIPGLYKWDTEHNEVGRLAYSDKFQSLINNNTIPSYYYEQLSDELVEPKFLYSGLLNSVIDPGYKQGFTEFYWQYNSTSNESKWAPVSTFSGTAPDIQMSNLSSLLSFARLTHLKKDNNNYSEDRPYLQLLSTDNETLENYRFRLIASNLKGSNVNTVQPVTVKLLLRNTISVPSDATLSQHKRRSVSTEEFECIYEVTNPTDLTHNHYEWYLTKNNESPQLLAQYFTTLLDQGKPINFLPTFASHSLIIVTGDKKTHTLKIRNDAAFFQQQLANDNDYWSIKLVVRNLLDYIEGKSTVGPTYLCYSASALPWINTEAMANLPPQSIEFTRTQTFIMKLHIKMAYTGDNKNLSAEWKIGNKNVTNPANWEDLTTWVQNNSNIFQGINIDRINDNTSSDINYTTAQLTVINSSASADAAIDILANKVIYVRMKNDAGWTPTWYSFTNFNITNPITTTSWDDNLKNILLEDNAHNAVFELQAENATNYQWEIKQPDGSSVQNIPLLTSTNTSASLLNGRYSIEYLATGSKLTINIPAMLDELKFRDNGTQIRCQCSNASTINDPKYVPSNNDWTTLSVNYPIQIISPNSCTGEWWPIEGKQNVLSLITFSIPKPLGKTYNNNTIDIDGTLSRINISVLIDKILTVTVPQGIFVSSLGEITYKEEDNNNLIFTGYPKFSLKDFSNLTQLELNDEALINTESIAKDRLYNLYGNIQIKYTYNNNLIITTIPLTLNIRQNKPEVISDPNHIVCPTESLVSDTDELIPNLDAKFTYYYATKPSQTSMLTLSHDDSQLLTINLNSISTYKWKLPEKTDLSARAQYILNVTPYVDIFSPSTLFNRSQQLCLWSESNKLGIKSDYTWFGDTIKWYVGADEDLFLIFSNPWGNVITKRFTFRKGTAP